MYLYISQRANAIDSYGIGVIAVVIENFKDTKSDDSD